MATDMASALEGALGRGNAFGLAWIDRDLAFKRPRNPLEAGFGDVVAVGAVERLDVQREPGVAGESLEELAHKLSVEGANPLGREFGPKDQERPARHVEGDAGQRLVHRQQTIGIAGEPSLVAERFAERLAEGDADVLDRVMIVDVTVALGADDEINEGMARELVEHM